MTTSQSVNNVFLVGSALDRPLQRKIVDYLQEFGVGAYSDDLVQAGDNWVDESRVALAQSSAAIAVVTKSALRSPNFLLELGIALGWGKPVFVLIDDDVETSDLPSYLAQHRAFGLAQVESLAQEVVRAVDVDLSGDDIEALKEEYSALGVSIDQLVVRPRSLDQLARRFNDRTRRHLTPESLLLHMLRQRKKGAWPKLTRKAKTA